MAAWEVNSLRSRKVEMKVMKETSKEGEDE